MNEQSESSGNQKSTDQYSLDVRLRAAAARRMTPKEEFEQRASFVYGQLDSEDKRTAAEVRAYMLEHTDIGRAIAEIERLEALLSAAPQSVGVEAWAVFGPDWKPYLYTCATTEAETWGRFLTLDETVDEFKSGGYTCKKIRISLGEP